MGKREVAVEFDQEYLNQISRDENACVSVQKNKKHLALHPKYLTNTKESIKYLLNRSIGRFNRELDGIVLGYQNVILLSNTGVLNYDNPFVHLDVEAEFFVFKAKLGQVLHGVVNRITEDHVGCLVHNTFTVSLLKPNLDEEWIGDMVDMGYEVLLRITYTKFDERLPYIRAEFISVISGGKKNKRSKYSSNSQGDSSAKNVNIEVSDKYKKGKCNKRKIFEAEDSDDNKIDLNETSDLFNVTNDETREKKKKNKRDKHKQHETCENFDSSEASHSRSTSKKRKHKDESNDYDTCTAKNKKSEKSKSIEEKRKFLQVSIEELIQDSDSAKNSNIKKSKKKRKDPDEIEAVKSEQKKRKHEQNLSESLPDLNLDELFNSMDTSRMKSKESFINRSFDLPPDSDLEKILSNANDTVKDYDESELSRQKKRRKTCSIVI